LRIDVNAESDNDISFQVIVTYTLLSITLYCSTILPLSTSLVTYISAIQIVLCISIIMASFSFAEEGKKKSKHFSIRTISQYLVILIFCISVLWYNSADLKSLNTLLKVISIPFLLYTYYILFSRTLFEDRRNFEKFTTYILWFGLFAGIVSLFSLVYPINPKYEGLPSAGLLNHPNSTSFIFTISIAVLFYKYFEKKIPVTVFGILIVLFSIALFFTLSRAGYIATSLAVLILTYNRSKKLFFASIIILMIVSVTFLLDINFAKTDSNTSRFSLILSALMMIFSGQQEMLWGHGIQNAFLVFDQTKATIGSLDPVPNPHNVLLLMTMQFGLLMTASVLFFLFMIFINTFLILRKSVMLERENDISLSLALSCSLLLQNFFEDIIIFPEAFVFTVFIIFLGYLNYTIKVYKNGLIKNAT